MSEIDYDKVSKNESYYFITTPQYIKMIYSLVDT